MIRTLIAFGIALAVAVGAVLVAEQGGQVVIVLGRTEITMTVGIALALVALSLALVVLVMRLASLVLRAPGGAFRWGRRQRQRRGERALARGLVAVAAGDARGGLQYAQTARKLLADAPLTRLLAAQAAQLEGDEAAVTAHYTAMLDNPETAFLGQRGLFTQAMRRGDNGAALDFAQRAAQERPKTPWVVNALFELQSARGDWAGAARALEAQTKAKVIAPSVAARRRAVLLTGEALDLEGRGEGVEALAKAMAALQLAPGLVPAAVLASRHLIAEGRAWKAAGILEQAWAQNPHPDLAAAYADLKPEESREARARRLLGLVELNPSHPESRLLAAAQAVATGDFGTAREALEPLLSPMPTARTCALMADVEQGETGDAARVREWLARSVRAPRDAAWVCEACGAPSALWRPVCPSCAAFDTLAWRSAGEAMLAVGAPLDPDDAALARVLYRGPESEAARPPLRADTPTPRPTETPRDLPAVYGPPWPPDDPGPDAEDASDPITRRTASPLRGY